MISLLNDFAIFQHQNLIWVSEDFQAMNDHDNGLLRVDFRMACWKCCSFSGSTLMVASSRMIKGASLSMDRTRKMIQTGKYSILDISLFVGYSNPGHFSAAFKKFYRHLPSYSLPKA